MSAPSRDPLRVSIISVGDELMTGRVVDQHAATASARLSSLGAEIFSHRTVGDREGALASAITQEATRADVILITGGLGPTEDDRTREEVAAAAGVGLEFREPWWEKIAERFRQIGIDPFVDEVRGHHHRRSPFDRPRERLEVASDIARGNAGECVVRVEVSASQTGEVLEDAEDSGIAMPIDERGREVAGERGIAPERATPDAGIVGTYGEIADRGEVSVDSQSAQLASRNSPPRPRQLETFLTITRRERTETEIAGKDGAPRLEAHDRAPLLIDHDMEPRSETSAQRGGEVGDLVEALDVLSKEHDPAGGDRLEMLPFVGCDRGTVDPDPETITGRSHRFVPISCCSREGENRQTTEKVTTAEIGIHHGQATATSPKRGFWAKRIAPTPHPITSAMTAPRDDPRSVRKPAPNTPSSAPETTVIAERATSTKLIAGSA